MNIQEHQQREVVSSYPVQQSSKAFGVAALVQSIPMPVTVLVIALVCLFIGGAAGFNAQSVPVFISVALVWLKWGFIVVVALVSVKVGLRGWKSVHTHYHETRMAAYERGTAHAAMRKQDLQVENQRLKNEQLSVKIDLERQLPVVIQYALSQGHNVRYGKDGLQVENYLSNLHALAPGADIKQIAPPVEKPLVEKPSVDALVAAVEQNSLQIAFGVNVETRAPIVAELPGNHIIILGRSQMGKSSLIGGVLRQVTQTHDIKHLKLAILDLEDMTGKLFDDDPHILTIRASGNVHHMHARTVLEVSERLTMLYRYMEYRYLQMSRYGVAWLEEQPSILVYLEEFLAFKKSIKPLVGKEAFETVMNSLLQLSTRGLKANMHLMVCAQVQYADDDLKEIIAQLTGIRIALAVNTRAALAAGFVETQLLNTVYRESTKGQFVVEKVGGGEIGMAAQFDARALVKALRSTPGRSMVVDAQSDLDGAMEPLQPREELEETPEQAHDNVRTFPLVPRPEKKPVPTLLDAKRAWNDGAQGPRPMMRAIDCTYYQAQQFCKLIEEEIRSFNQPINEREEM